MYNMLQETTLLRYLSFEIQPTNWDIVMCLKAVVWVILPLGLDQHAMPTYQFMKSSAASKLSVMRLLLEGRLSVGWRSHVIAFFAGGRRKETIIRRHEYSSGLFSPSFGGDRWPTLAAAGKYVSHVERGGGTICDDELWTRSSSSAIGGVASSGVMPMGARGCPGTPKISVIFLAADGRTARR